MGLMLYVVCAHLIYNSIVTVSYQCEDLSRHLLYFTNYNYVIEWITALLPKWHFQHVNFYFNPYAANKTTFEFGELEPRWGRHFLQRRLEPKLRCGQSSVKSFYWSESDCGTFSDDSDKRGLAQIVRSRGQLLIMLEILLDLDKQWKMNEWINRDFKHKFAQAAKVLKGGEVKDNQNVVWRLPNPGLK